MRKRGPSAICRVAVWLGVVLAASASADNGTRPLEGGEKVRVSWRLLVTPPEGATAVRFRADTEQAVAEEHPSLQFGFADGSAPDDPWACRSSMFFGPFERQVAEYPLLWTADARVIEASIDDIVMALDWKRLASGPDGAPVKLAGESIPKVTLREGERVLLDFVTEPQPGASPCARNLALEVTAGIKENPDLAGKRIAYDVWLVHNAPGGGRASQHWKCTAGQGEQRAFAFEDEQLEVTSGSDRARTLQISVGGDVRGRVRQSGALDLSLRANRELDYADSGEHLNAEGHKKIRAQPGEVIRMDLPGAPCAAGANPPCPVGSAGVRQPFGRDMAGHSFALIIKATPLP